MDKCGPVYYKIKGNTKSVCINIVILYFSDKSCQSIVKKYMSHWTISYIYLKTIKHVGNLVHVEMIW